MLRFYNLSDLYTIRMVVVKNVKSMQVQSEETNRHSSF